MQEKVTQRIFYLSKGPDNGCGLSSNACMYLKRAFKHGFSGTGLMRYQKSCLQTWRSYIFKAEASGRAMVLEARRQLLFSWQSCDKTFVSTAGSQNQIEFFWLSNPTSLCLTHEISCSSCRDVLKKPVSTLHLVQETRWPTEGPACKPGYLSCVS